MTPKDKSVNDNSNIFDDFSSDMDLITEVKKLKKNGNKDLFYYLYKVGSFISIAFWLFVILIIIVYLYIYIQNDSNRDNVSLLDPFCSVILGNIDNDDVYCSSIASVEAKYLKRKKGLENEYNSSILNNIENLYNMVNFTKTRKVLFLSDKSNKKMDVLLILSEFDKLKVNFDSLKDRIQCSNFIIDSTKKTLSMSCIAFSEGYEKGIMGFDASQENSIKGTSISIANSFLNYIEKKSDFFILINKQKLFTLQNIVGEKTNLTNSTSFKIELLYRED